MNAIIPCLWFDREAEEAARFYTEVIPDARLGSIAYYGEGAPMPPGTVLTVRFTLLGQPFMALNGGPQFPFSPAVSFVLPCETQHEIDHCWEQLSAGGATERCGWLRDRFGVSWQIVPRAIAAMMEDRTRADQVMAAVLTMEKLDMAAIQAAYDAAP